MKFRNLLTALGVFAATCLIGLSVFAGTDAGTSPAVFVKGLLMLQLERADGLQIILPEAAAHNATIAFVMNDGTRKVLPFKGHNIIRRTGSEPVVPNVHVPELIRLKELFGDDATAQVDQAPNTVSIPWSSIRSVTTEETSPVRYTFIRKDNGEEIPTFRPRNIAETLRVELTSSGQLDFSGLKADIDMRKVKEIWVEQVPKTTDVASGDLFQQHFHHYLHYISRPAGQTFDVEPKRLAPVGTVAPRFGQSFWLGGNMVCGPFWLD